LLPYLNQITDYSFLQADVTSLVTQYLSSLIIHIKDTSSQVEMGFILFGLKYSPAVLKEIAHFKNNRVVLRKALEHLDFTSEIAEMMSTSPQKFLWPGLLQFFRGKLSSSISDCVKLLNKMDILNDPGP
jgi:hypothetical protein